MPPHRIIKSEADQPKPLAYIRMYPQARRRLGGYVTAAVAGGAAVIVAAAALALIQNRIVG